MSFLGLVPSEYSSGESRRLGKITKCRSAHVRRVLMESAWTYCYPARLSHNLTMRQQHQPRAIRDIAWRAQSRGCSRYRRRQARGVHQNKICVAIARELAAFVWDIAQHVPPLGLNGSCTHQTEHHANTQRRPIGNATQAHDEGNRRRFYVGIEPMIPADQTEAAPRRIDDMR